MNMRPLDAGNHDVQFITTKNHALSAMYYINKYISKQETSTYSKLTIASAVRKDSTSFVNGRIMER